MRRAEIGDRDRDRARAADDDLRPRQHRLDEDVHRALARAHVLGEAHAGALLAGGDALLLQRVGRLHRDEARLAVGERFARRLQHGGARAAAADPALRDRAVGQDHGLGAGLGRGRGHGAHDGRERERLARRALAARSASRMSVAWSITDPREIRLERREAVEIVRRREQVDIGQGRLHAARLRAVVPPADQRVEPDDAAAAPAQAPHLGAEPLRLAGVVAVARRSSRRCAN